MRSRRTWAALANPNAGEVLVSAAEGYEFADLGGGDHVGGGSHGSLVAGDSEVPLLPSASKAAAASIVDVAPLVLAHFGVAAPAYALGPRRSEPLPSPNVIEPPATHLRPGHRAAGRQRARPAQQLGAAREVLHRRRERLRRQPRRLRAALQVRRRSTTSRPPSGRSSSRSRTTTCWNRLWTFQEHQGSVAYQGLRFLVVSTLALGANLVVLYAARQAGVGAILAQAIAIVLVTPLNFVGNKLWSFRR